MKIENENRKIWRKTSTSKKFVCFLTDAMIAWKKAVNECNDCRECLCNYSAGIMECDNLATWDRRPYTQHTFAQLARHWPQHDLNISGGQHVFQLEKRSSKGKWDVFATPLRRTTIDESFVIVIYCFGKRKTCSNETWIKIRKKVKLNIKAAER